MKTNPPRSARQEPSGLVYFARMLDKIRLNASGELAPGYFLGVDDPTFFDARCVNFLGIDYDALARRTVEGGSDEEILNWCLTRGRKPTAEQIIVWNAFLLKRGWRDESSSSLQTDKAKAGFATRDEIQTWVDLQDAEEGRTV